MGLEVCLEACTAEEKSAFADSLPSEDTFSMRFVVTSLLQSDKYITGKRIQQWLRSFQRDRSSDIFAMEGNLAADAAKHFVLDDAKHRNGRVLTPITIGDSSGRSYSPRPRESLVHP